jgi:hypothetical protein
VKMRMSVSWSSVCLKEWNAHPHVGNFGHHPRQPTCTEGTTRAPNGTRRDREASKNPVFHKRVFFEGKGEQNSIKARIKRPKWAAAWNALNTVLPRASRGAAEGGMHLAELVLQTALDPENAVRAAPTSHCRLDGDRDVRLSNPSKCDLWAAADKISSHPGGFPAPPGGQRPPPHAAHSLGALCSDCLHTACSLEAPGGGRLEALHRPQCK